MSTMAARPGQLVLALLATLPLAACSPGPAPADRYVLHQKGQYQALYDHSGRMVRLLQDKDGDGRAELVVVMGPTGKPERGEMDQDGDGIVDRREHFAPDGSLERVEEVEAPGSPR